MRRGFSPCDAAFTEGAFPLNKRFPHGIDITAPGGITALMDFHRLTFGDAVMEDDAGGDNGGQGTGGQPQQNADQGDKPKDGDDKPLGEGGLKALQAERDARTAAEKRAAEAEAKIQAAEDAKLSDIQRAQKERDEAAAENAKLKAANARLAALAEYPVPKDYQDLVTGTDEASYLASAKKISELYAKAEGKAPKPDPVPRSGDRSTDNDASGGGINAARRKAAENRHKS